MRNLLVVCDVMEIKFIAISVIGHNIMPYRN